MAEVILTKSNMIPISYIDNVLLTTAKITPPSMTYIDSSTQVTAQPGNIYFSYQEGQEVTIESRIQCNTVQTVELEARTARGVETDDPFRVNLNGLTSRSITNSIELESILTREVVSYNVKLDSATRRVVTTDVDIEGNINRKCEIELKLSSKLERVITSDGEIPVDVIHKEYGSFVDKAKLFRVQHDVLDENVSDNPYFNRDIANIGNSVLLTKNQTVIKAINEIFVYQRDLFFNTVNSFKKFNTTIGDVVIDKKLNNEYQKIGAKNVIEALTILSSNLNKITDFVGYEYGEDGESLVNAIRATNERIDAIAVEWRDIKESDIAWIFKAAQTIPELEDRVYSMMNDLREEIDTFRSSVENRYLQLVNTVNTTITNNYNGLLEKINTLANRVDFLDDSKRTLNRKLDVLADQITLAFKQYTAINQSEIRAILATLEDIETDDPTELGQIAQNVYDRLVEYIETKIEVTNRNVIEIDNRVTELETKFDTTFTSDDLVSEDDIIGLFNAEEDTGTSQDTGPEETQTPSSGEDGNNDSTDEIDEGTNVNIQEVLDMVANSADIQELFVVGDRVVNGMLALLTLIAEISQELSQNENNG